MSEATLVARAQDGDVDAFETLVRGYQGELFRLGYRMTNDRGEAQDALQDTLILAWRRLPSLTDTQAFRAWIFQLMTRQCLSLLRRRARRQTMVAAAEPGSPLEVGEPLAAATTSSSPEESAAESALVAELRQALAELPDELRVCWVLKELHDMTYPEISYAVGVPVSTVRGRIARARTRLAKGMAAWR
jgi:RNA polymerase sigma-70 factor (ECF subfamily)